jgi:hypothetical protein
MIRLTKTEGKQIIIFINSQLSQGNTFNVLKSSG